MNGRMSSQNDCTDMKGLGNEDIVAHEDDDVCL